MTDAEHYRLALEVIKANLLPADMLEQMRDISPRNAALMGLYIQYVLDGMTPAEADEVMKSHV